MVPPPGGLLNRSPVEPPRRWSPARLGGLAALLWLSACDAGAGGNAVRTDSAGVEIVQLEAPAERSASPAWSAEEVPLVHIGVSQGAAEYQLFGVVGAGRLSDGGVVVGNGGTNELRFYDARGSHVASLGGSGNEEGRFGVLSRIEVGPGDTVFAWDARFRRLSIFGPEREFVRTVSLEALGERSLPAFAGRFADGTFLVTDRLVIQRDELSDGMVLQGLTAYVRYAPDGTPRDTIGRFPWRPAFVQVQEGGGFAVYPIPFAPSTHFAIDGDRLLVAVGHEYEVRTYRNDGTLERILRRAHARPLVSRDMVETVVQKELERYRVPEARERAAAAYGAMPYPARLPALDGLLVDAEHRVWVQEHALPGESGTRWSVFDAEGAELGEAHLPEDFVPLQIGSDWTLGVWRNSVGVEHVRIYALGGGPSQGG